MKSLSFRQKVFVDEYLIDLNASKAGLRAGYCKNYAGRLLNNNALVKEALKERMSEREKRTEITQDKVLRELADIAFAKSTDYVEIIQNETGAAEVSFIPTARLPEDKKAAVAGIKKMQSGIEIKLYDKMKALELLGKHLGVFVDKNEDKNREVKVIIDSIAEELAE